MAISRLRVNGLVMATLDLRRKLESGFSMLVTDPWLGELSLTPACLIEYQDTTRTDGLWMHLTYEELARVVAPYVTPPKEGSQ
jgi:hypothetical protein